MRRRFDTTAAVAFAAEQDGVLTRREALDHGVTDDVLQRLVADRWWQRLARGIYVAGNAPVTWQQRARGALLWAGRSAALGRSAAAYRHGLVTDPPEVIDVWVPGTFAHRENRTGWRLHHDFEGRLARCRGHLTVTSVEDTVLDTADACGIDEALSVLTRALATRRTHESRLREALTRRTRVRHRAVLEDVVSERRGYESALEYHADIAVLRRHGLPRGTTQVVTRAGRVDRLLEEFGLVLEFDGRMGHEGDGDFRDAQRDNTHALDLLRSLRIGWKDVRVRPCITAATIAAMLHSLGWTGELRRCRDCPPPG